MSLPEKWFIIRNDSNYKEINEWFNKTKNTPNSASDKTFMIFNSRLLTTKNNNNIKELKSKGFEEITFEQFRRYVLKEETIYEIY